MKNWKDVVFDHVLGSLFKDQSPAGVTQGLGSSASRKEGRAFSAQGLEHSPRR